MGKRLIRHIITPKMRMRTEMRVLRRDDHLLRCSQMGECRRRRLRSGQMWPAKCIRRVQIHAIPRGIGHRGVGRRRRNRYNGMWIAVIRVITGWDVVVRLVEIVRCCCRQRLGGMGGQRGCRSQRLIQTLATLLGLTISMEWSCVIISSVLNRIRLVVGCPVFAVYRRILEVSIGATWDMRRNLPRFKFNKFLGGRRSFRISGGQIVHRFWLGGNLGLVLCDWNRR